jgi:hypothetical protein
MKSVFALALCALTAFGCAAETARLSEQDLQNIRRSIRETYNAKDLEECRQSGAFVWDACADYSVIDVELFLESKDGEYSGYYKYQPRRSSLPVVTLWCNVTVYDSGNYIWKCEP